MDVEQVVEQFRAAAFGMAPWSDPLESMATLTKFSVAHLSVMDRQLVPMFNAAHGVTSDMLEEFLSKGGLDPSANPRAAVAVHATQMRSSSDDEFTSARDRDANPLYRDVFCRSGADLGIVVPLCVPETIATLTIMRSRSQPLQGAECKLLDAIAPSLRSSLRQSLHLGTTLENTVVATAGELGRAAVVLDGAGRPISVSADIEAMLSAARYLILRNGRLRGATPANDTALARAFDAACAGHSLIVVLTANNEGAPIVGELSPLPSRPGGPLSRGRVLLTVRQPKKGPSAALLSVAYGLTSAEAAVASLVAQGMDLAEIALQRGCSVGTIRSQLKAVFDKTGARRQAELVSQLLRLSC